MSIYCGTAAAIVFAGATMLACIIAISSIYDSLDGVRNELDTEIASFKVILNELSFLPLYLAYCCYR